MWDGGDGAGGTIADVAYVWQTSGAYTGSYQTVAVGDIIAGGQGFFVKTTGNTSVVFSNANRRGVTNPNVLPKQQRQQPGYKSKRATAMPTARGLCSTTSPR
jgi:hypothetical protein